MATPNLSNIATITPKRMLWVVYLIQIELHDLDVPAETQVVIQYVGLEH